jgi:hypothetical protein
MGLMLISIAYLPLPLLDQAALPRQGYFFLVGLSGGACVGLILALTAMLFASQQKR